MQSSASLPTQPSLRSVLLSANRRGLARHKTRQKIKDETKLTCDYWAERNKIILKNLIIFGRKNEKNTCDLDDVPDDFGGL